MRKPSSRSKKKKREIDRQKAEIDALRAELDRQREKEEDKAKIQAQAIVRDVQAQADAVLEELNQIKKLKDSEEFGKLLLNARSSVRGKDGTNARCRQPYP